MLGIVDTFTRRDGYSQQRSKLTLLATVSPTTTVTYTGAELTSYLLNGASNPETIADVNLSDIPGLTYPTDDPYTGFTYSTDGPTPSAQFGDGTGYSTPLTIPTEISVDTSSYPPQTSVPATQTTALKLVASSSGNPNTNITEVGNDTSSSSGSVVYLNTPAIVGIVVGTVALLAALSLALFLLARQKRNKDRQRLQDSPTKEKFTRGPPSPRESGKISPTKRSSDPFEDNQSSKESDLKRTGSNPGKTESDVTASFDFGGLVPTKNHYGNDGKPIIPAVWKDRDVGRPFSLSKVPAPSSTVAAVGDETPLEFIPRKNSSPNKVSPTSIVDSSQTDKPRQAGDIRRKVALQDRQLPISRPISPLEDADSLSTDSPLRAAPKPGELASLESDSSIASMVTNRKPRPAPIQVPPVRSSESRESIILDKSVSPPATLPPSIPTPPLPSLEFHKNWERLERESTLSVESTDTNILDEVSGDETTDAKIVSPTASKEASPQYQDSVKMPAPLRKESVVKNIPKAVVVTAPDSAHLNPGDILKKEKTLLRVPSAASSISSSSNSSIASSNGSSSVPPVNKRSASMVAASAKWAEKRKALNALANQSNARGRTEDAPLPNNAVEKVEEARKSLTALGPAITIQENTEPSSPKKREVEGRKGVKNTVTESVGSPTLSVFNCYDPERESTFYPGDATELQRITEGEDKENMPVSV